MANDFSKTRNDYQQYDLVTVFQSAETRIMRHLHVATMAVVTKCDGTNVQCMPFPIREKTEVGNIYAFNPSNTEYVVGDKVLVIFTDRDFRKNYDSATSNDRSIGSTNDAKLHSIDYGIVIPIVKESKASTQSLARATFDSKHRISCTMSEIEPYGSLYAFLGENANKTYNLYLTLDGKPPIPMWYSEGLNDFVSYDKKSFADYPDMNGLFYDILN